MEKEKAENIDIIFQEFAKLPDTQSMRHFLKNFCYQYSLSNRQIIKILKYFPEDYDKLTFLDVLIYSLNEQCSEQEIVSLFQYKSDKEQAKNIINDIQEKRVKGSAFLDISVNPPPIEPPISVSKGNTSNVYNSFFLIVSYSTLQQGFGSGKYANQC